MDSPYCDIADWFGRYYHAQTAQEGANTVLMALKHEHSINVAMHTAAISRDDGRTSEECRLAETLGLLHDVGRFPQLTAYGTFSDTRSIDHGELGADVVDREGILSLLDEPAASILRDGIRYHNARTIPAAVSPQSRSFLLAVRDADKLDIFRVINDAVVNNRIEDHPEITLNINIHGPINPAALAELERRENVSYTNVKSLADFGLTQLSWLYDLHFPYSLRYVLDHNIIAGILRIIPPHGTVAAIVDNIRRHLSNPVSRLRIDTAPTPGHTL